LTKITILLLYSPLLEAPLTHHKTQPPWEFLLSASRTSLQSYELSRLSHVANVRKEIGQLLDIYVEESSNAMLARLLIEQAERPVPRQDGGSASELLAKPPHSVSDNFLADQAIPPPRARRAS
jgi:hypothetical protein